MKNFYLILALFSVISCTNKEKNPTSLIIDSFIKNEYNENLFLHECSGMKYDESRIIRVSSEPFDFDFDSYLKGRNYSLQQTEIDKDIITNKVKIYNQVIPSKGKADYYFIRISNGAKVGSDIYYAFWIKGNYYSSGLKFIYKSHPS